MPYISIRQLFILLFVCLHAPLWAADADLGHHSVYRSTVYIENQAFAKRAAAFREALEMVLVRISGNPGINETAEAKSITAVASQFVKGFRYAAEGEPDIGAGPGPNSLNLPLLFSVDFNQELLLKALKERQIPVWTERPLRILFWVVEEAQNRPRIIHSMDKSEVTKILQRYALSRGMRLLLPVYDAQDRLALGPVDIRGGFKQTILSASRRYDADVVVTLNLLKLRTGDWTSSWTVLGDSTPRRWTNKAETQLELISEGINGVADILVSRYASTASQSDVMLSLLIQVDNIRGIQDYAAVSRYLATLSAVASVEPYKVMLDAVHYKISIQSDQLAFERQVQKSTLLQPVIGSSNLAKRTDLSYRYRGVSE